MAINLGQVGIVIFATTAPGNTNVIWGRTTTNDPLTWEILEFLRYVKTPSPSWVSLFDGAFDAQFASKLDVGATAANSLLLGGQTPAQIINAAVTAAVSAAVAAVSQINGLPFHPVADLAARDALTLSGPALVLVVSDVDAGGEPAYHFWDGTQFQIPVTV